MCKQPCAISFILVAFQLAFTACTLRSREAFRVIPHTPAYVLRSPDSRETPFPDILRNYNDFEPARSWIGLRPLMELRIENAYYKRGSSRRGLDGFLGTEVARYEVLPRGLRLVSVEPMSERPPTDKPVQDLISRSVADARFYRLYFEIVFNKANNSHGSVLLAANSQGAIEQLSAQLDHPEILCGENSAHCTAFPEACSVSVEMKVVVNGKAKSLLWGSTLASVVGDQPQHLELKRFDAGRLTKVEIDIRDAGTLKMPLLPGDHIEWEPH